MKKIVILLFLLISMLLTACSNQLEEEVSSLQSSLEENEKDLKEKDETIADLEKQVVELEAKTSEELEKQIRKLQKELSNKTTEIATLESQITELQPYKDQVEALEAAAVSAAENRNNPVEISINNFSTSASGSYIEVDGEVKNISDSTIDTVKLRAVFTDNSGNIIDSKDTYASTILPNGLTKYSTMIEYDSRIENVNIQVIDFRFE